MPSPRNRTPSGRGGTAPRQAAPTTTEYIYGPAAEVVPKDRCPRCGERMDKVFDKGTLCWDQLLEIAKDFT